MPDLGVAFFAVSVLFGAFTGVVLGRNPGDRIPTLAATTVCLLVGAASWTVGAPGTSPEVAGAAMTVGGASAGLVLAVTGRRSENAS
jgi:VIT1/CCC1 family predicted Fe2+/Mn2+ transporter